MNSKIFSNKNILQKIGSSKGFTLVEVLMAMIILLVGLLAVASMQIMAMRGNQHARETTERTTTADNMMEWLISLNFDHKNLRDEHDNSDNIDKHTLNIPSDGTAPTAPDDLAVSDDVLPPDNLIPLAGQSKNPIQSVDWVVYIKKDGNGDGDFTDDVDFNGYIDADSSGDFNSGDTITSKLIEVTVNWKGGGSTQISNIKPRL